MFFRAQYNAKMAPLINDITSIANAMPDIHVVAHVPTAGSVLHCATKKSQQRILISLNLIHASRTEYTFSFKMKRH